MPGISHLSLARFTMPRWGRCTVKIWLGKKSEVTWKPAHCLANAALRHPCVFQRGCSPCPDGRPKTCKVKAGADTGSLSLSGAQKCLPRSLRLHGRGQGNLYAKAGVRKPSSFSLSLSILISGEARKQCKTSGWRVAFAIHTSLL